MSETFKIVSRFDSSKILYQAKAESFRALLEAAVTSRANLSGAYLSRAYLSGANLSGAYLSGANLSGANLSGAYLSGANLSGAYLSRAYLSGANLSGAYLSGADLSGADLKEIKEADLTVARISILPSDGPVIGWKKCRNSVLVKLFIPSKARRSHASGRKCRAERAKVLEVIGAEFGVSLHDSTFHYKPGLWVHCAHWNEDRWTECGGGIHFYITRIEAENHS